MRIYLCISTIDCFLKQQEICEYISFFFLLRATSAELPAKHVRGPLGVPKGGIDIDVYTCASLHTLWL